MNRDGKISFLGGPLDGRVLDEPIIGDVEYKGVLYTRSVVGDREFLAPMGDVVLINGKFHAGASHGV